MLVIWGEYSLFLLVQFIYTLKPHCLNITGQWEQKFPCYIKPPQLIQFISTTKNISCPLMSSYRHSQKSPGESASITV